MTNGVATSVAAIVTACPPMFRKLLRTTRVVSPGGGGGETSGASSRKSRPFSGESLIVQDRREGNTCAVMR